MIDMKPYWDFAWKINAELKDGMSFKRSGNTITVAIWKWIGKDKFNEVYQRFIDFGFKAQRYEIGSEVYGIHLIIEKVEEE